MKAKDICYRIFIWSLIVLWLIPLVVFLGGVLWWIMSGNWVLTEHEGRLFWGTMWTVVGFILVLGMSDKYE